MTGGAGAGESDEDVRSVVDPGRQHDDVEAIGSVIATYQAAGRLGSRDLYGEAFHPEAVVSYPSEEGGRLVTTPIAAFADEVAEVVEQGGEVEETARETRIDVAGDVASARVDFTLRLGPDVFEGTDFMSFARVGGRWVITHKLYDMRPVVASQPGQAPD